MLQTAAVANGTTIYCGVECDWANRVAAAPSLYFSGVNDALLSQWDSFAQILFWMAIVFFATLVLHLLVNFVAWPYVMGRNTPKPLFLVFPRIEIYLALVGFTGACTACAAAIGTNTASGIAAGTIVLWAYPLTFLVRVS